MKKVLGTVRKFWLMVALIGLMSVTLAACGDDAKPSTGNTAVPTTAGATDNGRGVVPEYKVSLNDAPWSITPKTLEVKAGKSRIFVSNMGQFPHNLVIEGTGGGKTPTFKSSDGPQTLDVDLQPGTYKWLCTLPTHADKGMTGELVVK